MAVLFAATYPERTSALVLYGTYAKRQDPDEDYPWPVTREERIAYAGEVERTWGGQADLGMLAPNADDALAEWWSTRARAAAGPGAARDLILMNSAIDVRDVLPVVQAPTLVLHRTGDQDSNVEEGRYIADRIPGGRFIELEGDDHLPWVDSDQIIDEVEEFLTGVRRGPSSDRVLATVLFTDVVGSTERAAELGDHAWRELIERYDALVRHEIARHGGIVVDTAGDGVFARFDGPARAVRAARAIGTEVNGLGLEVRAGVHTGEVELVGDGVAGIAVHVGARISALAGPGEIWVSGTVKDLVVGSGIEFAERGETELKGVPGRWRVFEVVAA
jgi:class 3 adenylate cyclase